MGTGIAVLPSVCHGWIGYQRGEYGYEGYEGCGAKRPHSGQYPHWGQVLMSGGIPSWWGVKWIMLTPSLRPQATSR